MEAVYVFGYWEEKKCLSFMLFVSLRVVGRSLSLALMTMVV